MTTRPANPTQLVNAQTLAMHLGVSESTIYRLVQNGTIAPVRVGTRFRFDREAVTEDLMRSAQGRLND